MVKFLSMNQKLIITLLKWTCFFIFLGRAYQFIFWDAPFRSVLWDQELMSPIVEGIFNISWQDYATSLSNDDFIQSCIKINGYYYLLCAVSCLIIKPNSYSVLHWIIGFGTVLLVILALLQTKSKFYVFAMFFEHAIQFGIPFLLLYYLKHLSFQKLINPLKILTALTFLCHGLYALGVFFPLPANFVTMTINILRTSEDTTKHLLFIAAILDFVIVVGLFIPKISKQVLLYAVFWGFITALARVWSELVYTDFLLVMHQSLYETVFRFSHGLIPLLLYFLIKMQSVKPIDLQAS